MCVCVCVCVFRQHFFVNANFIKHNRHFMSTYFLLDPFEFPYYNAPFSYMFNSSAFKKTFMPNNTTTENSHRQLNNIRTSK